MNASEEGPSEISAQLSAFAGFILHPPASTPLYDSRLFVKLSSVAIWNKYKHFV